MLELENVSVSYGNIQVLHGISMRVDEGEIVAIIGANGAGKTTTLKAVSGLLPKKSNSSIRFMGEEIAGLPAERIVKKGLALSPEGRLIFPDMTVVENLEMGAYLHIRDKALVRSDIARMYQLFPRLGERRAQLGKTLSGGEQQMLAIARSLMAKPRLLLLDEPSTGLAPMIVEQIFGIIKSINQAGVTVLLVEQNARMALDIADRGYVLKNGEIVMSDQADALLNNDDIRKAYLGEETYELGQAL